MPSGERTCRRCRAKRPKKDLLRLVLIKPGVMEADLKQRLPGRGWYVCKQPACLSLFQDRKRVRKVFGRDLAIGPVLMYWITGSPVREDYAQT